MVRIMMIYDKNDDDDDDDEEEDHLFERLSPRSKNLFSWRPPTRISSHACWPSRSFSINIIIMIMIVIVMITIIMVMITIIDEHVMIARDRKR